MNINFFHFFFLSDARFRTENALGYPSEPVDRASNNMGCPMGNAACINQHGATYGSRAHDFSDFPDCFGMQEYHLLARVEHSGATVSKQAWAQVRAHHTLTKPCHICALLCARGYDEPSYPDDKGVSALESYRLRQSGQGRSQGGRAMGSKVSEGPAARNFSR